MLRVLILASWYPKNDQDPNGRFILAQAKALEGQAETRVIDVSHRFSLIPKPLKILLQTRAILGRLSRENWTPDIIHAHVAYPAGPIAIALKRKLGVPTVLTEHTGPIDLLFQYFGSKQGFGEHLLEYDRVVAVSSFLRTELLSTLPRTREIQVMGNVISERFFTPHLVSPPSEQPIPVAFIGRLTPEKGVPEFLEALKIYDQGRGPNLKLSWVGEGPLLEEVQKVTHSFSRIQTQIFSPADVRVEDILQSSRFFVLPSRVETFSMLAAEANALGRPVLGFKCGGPEDFISDERGELLGERDPEKLADGIFRFATEARWGDEAGLMESRRRHIERHFSARAISSQLLDLYRDVGEKS